ncbi:hypothetical protein SAMN05192574_102275 [Mucilaginibacter gossypiicola]|uniref:Uncharacterized protein n=1 Tax=Mucilaginibacter gossypiicola TaxID=551995 RepID=A0A1H8DBU7_9SPHI|nr:hypothetical protein SAMN05192574_102275 [Mucilaginibacter gossypiicola]
MPTGAARVLSGLLWEFGGYIGYTAEIDQTFRGNMEMCSAGI